MARPAKKNVTVSEQVTGPKTLLLTEDERYKKNLEGYDPVKNQYTLVQSKWPGELEYYGASSGVTVEDYESRGYTVVSEDPKVTGRKGLVLMAIEREKAASYMPTNMGTHISQDPEVTITSRELKDLHEEALTAQKTRPGAEYLSEAPAMRKAIGEITGQGE